MDFIPKSLLSDVKSLKKPFNKTKKSDKAEPKTNSNDPQPSKAAVPRTDTTRKRTESTTQRAEPNSSDSTGRKSPLPPPRDIHTVLSSATRKTKKLENIMLPGEFKSQPDIIRTLTQSQERAEDLEEEEPEIFSPETRKKV